MAAQLAQWRERAGLTQARLAELLGGYHVLTISGWERGEAEIPKMMPLALEALEHRIAEGEIDLSQEQPSRHKGEAHHDAKLTEEKVRKIKRQLRAGKKSINQIARENEVNAGTISKIKSGKTWKDVK